MPASLFKDMRRGLAMVRFAFSCRLVLCTVLATTLVGPGAARMSMALRHFVRRHVAHRKVAHRPTPRVAAPYDNPNRQGSYDPTPTCYGPGGKPYDPDIIGGRNHVGCGRPRRQPGRLRALRLLTHTSRRWRTNVPKRSRSGCPHYPLAAKVPSRGAC